MAGKRIVPASILLLISALLLVFLSPGGGVKATNWDTTNPVVLSDDTPGANADVTSTLSLASVDNYFASILAAAAPPEGQIALDSEIPDGSAVGTYFAATTMSIYNGPCTTPIVVEIPLMDCTTDTLDTVPWIATGDNLVQDNDNDMNENGTAAPNHDGNCTDGVDNGDGDALADGNDPDCNKDGDDPTLPKEAKDTNGIPTYCDHYPAFLNDVFNDLRPRARYVGHSVILSGDPATQLQFVVFNPEALGAPWEDTYGFPNAWVVDNPIAPVSPHVVTDICGPLTAVPTLLGQTNGSYTVTPGPEPYEVDRAGECDGDDDDSDNYIDDGCLVFTPSGPPGYVRYQNPPSNTGLYGTGTHALRTYTQSQRDEDGDTISNNLDQFPYDATNTPPGGWPGAGAPAGCTVTTGLSDYDQDCYPNRQDNCPQTPNGDPYAPVASGFTQSDTDNPPGTAAADFGPGLDGIGDACDNSPNTADGHYHVAMDIAYVCVPDNFGGDDTDGNGNPDNDGDGVCDSTEDLLGSDKDDAVSPSTPEHIAIDLDIATGTAAQAPGTCSNYTTYNHPDAGPINDDADGLTNAADPGCAAMAGDADQDGVPDSVDNCPAQKNQEQVDSDGDGDGDDCDADDDGDGVGDADESCMGTDPKDNSADHPTDDANPWDFDGNQVVDVTDALIFLAYFPSAATDPGDVRYDYTCSGPDDVVDVTDALIFLAKFPSDTKNKIQFVNTTGRDVNDIHIEFFAEITHIAIAEDNAGGTWECEKVPPLCANDTDDDGDTKVNDGCRPLFGGGEVLCDDAVDSDGDTKVNDGCDPVDDPEDRNTGGITYTHGSPSYKVNCKLPDGGYMPAGSVLTIKLKGKRPPVVRCYDWTADCEVVNSSSKPCSFHNDTKQDVYDLHVEFGLDTDGDTIADELGRFWGGSVKTPYEELFDWNFPQGIQSMDIPFYVPSTPLAPDDVVRARWWAPSPWTLQCWYWTDANGDPVPPLAHCPIDKEVIDIRFDYAFEYPWPGPEIVGNVLELPWFEFEQTKISVTSIEVNNSDFVPYDALVNFYADIPMGCWGRWVFMQEEQPYPPDPFWPFDIHTRWGDPFAPPMSPEQMGIPVDPMWEKEPGDGDPTTFEVDLHFQTRDYIESGLYDYTELPGMPVEILRFFDFHCEMPGGYVFNFCNKIEAKASIDNDGDSLVDEDPIDGDNNDGDLLTDEDPPEPMPDTNWANNVLCEPLTVILSGGPD